MGEAMRRRQATGKTRMVDYFGKFKKAVTRERDKKAEVRSHGNVVSKRQRAKEMRALKREYGLTRSDIGAIGAGDMKAPWEEGP